jgi:hypothetical protein
MTGLPLLTVALSSHRLEVLPAAGELMRAHQAIVLEEAPEPEFGALLAGRLDIEDYLAEEETEFPEFSRKQLELIRELAGAGRRIFQVEPYLERLTRIHELLAAGWSRVQVEANPELREVYDVESRASGALLAFYARAHAAAFPRVVAAVQEFARADAARFRLRDELRAQAVAALAPEFPRLYVEAGYIHLFLVKRLLELLRGKARVWPVFLQAPLVRPELGRPRPLGPGDLLTLFYIFSVALTKEKEDLLAARSLIYIQLLEKAEMAPASDPTPHLHDEIRAQRLSSGLSFQDCALLYPRVRGASPAEVVAEVRRHLGR